jgi:putative transposase
MALALRQAEGGTPAAAVCRKLGSSEPACSRGKQRFAGMGAAAVRKLRVVEEAHRKLRHLAAGLSRDKQMLQDVLRKKP